MCRRLRYLALTMCLAACSLSMRANDTDRAARSDIRVTPTAGGSWLNHLHRSFGDTSMGKTGRLGPPPSEPGAEPVGWQLGLLPSSNQSVLLHGADLYRLNCQACHGEAGLGAPPEINSVIDPVRATSIPLVMQRMKSRGMDITPAAAVELAKQSQDALLQRLHKGGQDMPPFPQLNDEEIRSLTAYLKQLAGVPGAAQVTVTEPPVRVGELIVKSTCHICHDAAGPNLTPQQLEDGAIPSLETLTARVNELELIRKVTSGAPIVMGTPPTPHRGRMPVFYYLSRDEAADVYLYLTTYPPSQVASAMPSIAGAQQEVAGSAAPPAPPARPTPARKEAQVDHAVSSDGIPDWIVTLSLIGLGSFVIALLTGGLGFAAYELCRLANKKQHYSSAAPVRQAEEDVGELVVRC